MSALPDAAVYALQRLQPHWHLDELCDVERLPGGYNNDNYAFDRAGEVFVLRVVRPADNPVDRAFEHNLLSGALGGLAPPLVAFDTDSGHMLTRRVRGPLLVDADVSIDTIARYLHHLHTNLPLLERRYDMVQVIADDLAAAAARGRRPPAWIDALIATLDTSCLRRAPCHNDLNPWNVVVGDPDPTRWCTLDWEFAGNNDPLFDVLCIAGGMGWTTAQADALIDGYHVRCGQRLPTGRQRHVVWQAYWLREYAWAFAQDARGNTRAEIGAQLQRSANALRNLSAAGA